jgi:hypothetical protein
MPSPASRRRVSRRTYLVRRAVAASVVLVALLGAVKLAALVLPGDNTAGASDPTAGGPDTSVAGSASAGSTTAQAGSVSSEAPVPGSTTTSGTPLPAATAAPVDTGPPSAANPAKVYVVGDSDAGAFGPYLEKLLDGTGMVTTELNYKVSSGLARPDFFDWPAELATALPKANPDIVVATFGGNDSQGLTKADGSVLVSDPITKEAGWSKEYEQRVGEVMDLMLQGGRTVIWVGIPNDDNPDVTARLAIQDQAVRAAAAARPGVKFIDTWDRFSGRDGGWAEFVIDPRDGLGKDVRASDGFHLNTTGAEILALDIAQAVRDDLRSRGATI